MHCYLCGIKAGEIELREHKSARWLIAELLDSVEWLPADKEIVNKLN
jgi:8-oxo-dGTP diphosphatase